MPACCAGDLCGQPQSKLDYKHKCVSCQDWLHGINCGDGEMNDMTCAKCAMEKAERDEAAEQDNTSPSHNEQDNRNNDHNEDADADRNEEDRAAEDNQDGENSDEEEGTRVFQEQHFMSDGNNRWSKSGRRFTSTDEAIVYGDKDKSNPGSYLWVRPKLLSRMARHQVGRLIQHLNLHKFSEIRRLAQQLNLPPEPTARQIRERDRALGGLVAGLKKFREFYAKKIVKHESATLPETNRALLACYLMADYEKEFRISLYLRMRGIKKLKNQKFRSLFPLIKDVRVYDLMLKKLADRLRDEQKEGTTITIQLVRNYGLDAYDEACREVEQQDATNKDNDNSNCEEQVSTRTEEIEFVELDDKDTNSAYDMGEEFPSSQFEQGESAPNPASTVRVLEPLFPREVQEQLASLAFAFSLHDRNWLDALCRCDDTAVNRLAEELNNFCNTTCKNGWQTKTGRALLSCLRGVQSDQACAFLEDSLRLENCRLKRTLYRCFFPITTVKSLYDDSLMFLDIALQKCIDQGETITVPLLRKLAIQSHLKAHEVYNQKRRDQDKARNQSTRRQDERSLRGARAAGKRHAAGSKTPAAPRRKRSAPNVTASTQKKTRAKKNTATKKKPAPNEKATAKKRPTTSKNYSDNDSDDNSVTAGGASRALRFSGTASFTKAEAKKRTRALKAKYPHADYKDILLAKRCGMDPIDFMDIVHDERIRRRGITREEVCAIIEEGHDPIEAVEDAPEKTDDEKET